MKNSVKRVGEVGDESGKLLKGSDSDAEPSIVYCKTKNKDKGVWNIKELLAWCTMLFDQTPLLHRKPGLRSKKLACIVGVLAAIGVCVIVVALVVVTLTKGSDDPTFRTKDGTIVLGHSSEGYYSNAAVSSDAGECSVIGMKVLQEGGSVIDSAIATLLCVGVINAQSMGIGGGFLMTVYNKSGKSAYTIDAREEAPGKANETMFVNPYDSKSFAKSDASRHGGLAVAVPGELRGYEAAYELGGKLPWKRLFEPTIKLCREGHLVNKHMANALRDEKKFVLAEPSMSIYWADTKGTDVKKFGDTVFNVKLAETLELIANSPTNSADDLYNGSLTDRFVRDIQEKGGIITREDLEQYKPRVEHQPVKMQLKNNKTIYTMKPPSSGVLISFMLALFDGLNINPQDYVGTAGQIEAYHLLTEAFKFSYNFRGQLGDIYHVSEEVANNNSVMREIKQVINNLTNPEFADQVRRKITNETTHDPDYYGKVIFTPQDHGTAHLSIIAANGDAVSVTSTVNLYFGAIFHSRSTGILLNDEMDDFSTPNETNYFNIAPSVTNFIEPRKRPLSSMCPLIIVDDHTGNPVLAIGAAGGSRITSAVMFTIANHMYLGNNLRDSIDKSRLHHQLHPNNLMFEKAFPSDIADGLRAKGHNVTALTGWGSVVVGISRMDDGRLHAVSDFRKNGYPAGY